MREVEERKPPLPPLPSPGVDAISPVVPNTRDEPLSREEGGKGGGGDVRIRDDKTRARMRKYIPSAINVYTRAIIILA